MEVEFETVREIIQAAFPGRTTRKTVKIEVTDGQYQVSNYWSEGSRDFSVFVELATLRAIDTESLPKEARQEKNNPLMLPIGRVQMTPGIVVVENSYFQGKDTGFRVYIHPDNVTKMLPAKSAEEMLVERDRRILVSYRSLKSGPYRQEALRAHNVTDGDIDRLVTGGYLTRNAKGAVAITNKGRSAVANEL